MVSDQFCLKWSDFLINVSSSFRELRSDEELTDVTLVCTNNQQIEAHKVILAAGSPFFKSLFTRNKHQHPLIYMRGIKAHQMISIVDFMYNGEVNIYQEELNEFLSIAEEIELKGLTEFVEESKEMDKTKKIDVEHSVTTPVENMVQIKEIKSDLYNMDDVSTIHEIAITDDNMESPIDKSIVMEATSVVSFKDGFQELDERINSMMTRMNGLWSCQICQLTNKDKTRMKKHIESKHIEDMSHPCSLCGKLFRSRNNLKVHLSRNHRN